MTNFYLDLTRAFDIHVSFSAKGLEEAGKLQQYLKDAVVVSVGDVTKEDTDKATDKDTEKDTEINKSEDENILSDEVTEEKDDEDDADNGVSTDTMSVLDDKFFAE